MPAEATKPPLSDATGAFGNRVREGRLALGISQEKLAERSSLHWSYIGQVERGQNNLTLHNILKIAEVLDVDPADLVRGLRPPDDVIKPPRRLPSAKGRLPAPERARPRKKST